jgi:hypothetical protein
MPELAQKLAAVSEAAEELRRTEETRDQARERFGVVLKEAHEAGASYGLLGRIVGLSRQRVAEIISND